jgi:hypothetical protein
MLTVLLGIAKPSSSTPGTGASTQPQAQSGQDLLLLSRTTNGSPVKEIFCRSGERLSLSVVDSATTLKPPPSADSSPRDIYCFHAVRSPGSVPDLVGHSHASHHGKDSSGEVPTIGLSSSCSCSYFPPIPNRQNRPHAFLDSKDGAVGSSSSGSQPARAMTSLPGAAEVAPCVAQFLVERTALPTLDTPQFTYQPPPQRPPSSRGAIPNRRRVHRSDSESDSGTDSNDSDGLEAFLRNLRE